MAVDKNKSMSDTGYKDGYQNYYNKEQDLMFLASQGIFINPYEYINLDAYKGNDYGKQAYERDLALLQYYADYSMQQAQNKYNERMLAEQREYDSYESQVRRMKEAGLNPDLLGVSESSNSPLSSASGPSASGLPSVSHPSVPDNIMKVADLMRNVGSLASDLSAGGYKALNERLNVQSSELQLAQLASEFALQNLQGFGEGQRFEYLNNLPLSRSMRKRIESIYRTSEGSKRLSKIGFDFDKGYMQSESDYYRMMSDPRFNPGDYDKDGYFSEKDWLKVWKPVTDAIYKEMKSSFENKTSQNMLNKDQADMMKSLKEPLQQVVKNLKSKSDEDKKWATYALIALYGALSSTTSYSSNTDAKGNKSSGFSFGF